MDQCFVVLWIPKIDHLPLPFDMPYHEGCLTVNISDDPHEEFSIRVETDNKDIDIFVQCEGDSNVFEHFLRLEFLDFSHNGMVKYRYVSRFLEDSEFGFDGHTFPEAVYHMIKSLYHKHDFHEDESDSSLKPFITCEDIDIHKPDNDALNWYLLQYESTVQNLVKKAQVVVRHAVELEKEHRDDEIRKRYESFLQMYVMVLGYDAYGSTLYRSIYNNRYRIDVHDKEYRRHAFNIENSVKYFNVLYLFFDSKIRLANNYSILSKAEENLRNSEESLSRLERTFNTSNRNLEVSLESLATTEQTLVKAKENIEATQKSANSSTRWAIFSIVLSVIVAIGSLWYSIYSAKNSSEELDRVKIELLNTLKDLKKDQTNHQAVDSTNNDSLKVPTHIQLPYHHHRDKR